MLLGLFRLLVGGGDHFLEVGHHAAQGVKKRAQFIVAGYGELFVQIALGDGLGARNALQQVADNGPGDQKDDQAHNGRTGHA